MTLNELERQCVETLRTGDYPPVARGDAPEDWLIFGLDVMLYAGRLVRESRLASAVDLGYKVDGSPATLLEERIERELESRLEVFAPGAVVVGEETGGTLPEDGVAVAIDPVDGTWSFLSRTETLATVVAAFRDGEVFLAMVANPATGEVGYAVRGDGTRLLQLPVFGADACATDLPMQRLDSGATLVNAQPGRQSAPLVAALYEAWHDGNVRFVRSPGGSPSWALLEAAKGAYVYVNLWGKRRAEAFDLAAGVLLVEGAGGKVVDLEGNPIDPVHHEGPFVASVDETKRREVVQIVRGVPDLAAGV